MVEWSITAVLKTSVPRGTGGSNPSLSAEKIWKPADFKQVSSFLPLEVPFFFYNTLNKTKNLCVFSRSVLFISVYLRLLVT